jgi:hypothetical protein
MSKTIFLIPIILSYFVYGQEATIIIEVSDTEVEVGQNVTISIKSNRGGNIDFQFPKNFQKGYAQMEGMSQEYSNGKSTTSYYKTQNGYFSEKGSYLIGPALIKSGGKLIKSNKVKVTVNKNKKSAPKKKNGNFNFKTIKTIYGETNPSKIEVYEGEAICLNAKIYSMVPFSKYGYTPYIIEGRCDNFELTSKTPLSLVQENIGGQEYYTLELDEHVIFPITSGAYKVNPFKMDIVENRVYTVYSDPKIIQVRKLPYQNKPASFRGLVGDFDYRVELSNKEADLNEVITLQVSIDGVGNLQHASIPDLILPKELELYADPVEVKNYEITKNGFEGKLTYTYPIKVIKQASSSIAPIELSYFNSSTKEYVVYRSETLNINSKAVLDNEKETNEENAIRKLDFSNAQINKTELLENNNDGDGVNPVLLYSLGFGAFGALLFLFLWKRKTGKDHQVNIHIPTIRELKNMIQEIDQLPTSDQSDLLLVKMEECLSKICSFYIGTDRIHVSRNELYVLLLEPLNQQNIEELKDLFNRIDVLRYSKEMSEDTLNDIKMDFNRLTSELLNKGT